MSDKKEHHPHFPIHLPHKHHEEVIVTNPTWEKVKLARNPERPHTRDYLSGIFSDFLEFHGDRVSGDDPAIVGGMARFEGETVMVVGHQKGRTTKENIARKFGMPKAEGFRKAERLMKQAARFGYPILTFLDTPGADPSMEAEEKGISQAISSNIVNMLTLQVPIIVTIIGEGGSGGALGIGIGDRVLMLENSIFTVASPEPAAAILWHDAKQAPAAAEAMRLTAQDNLAFGIIDEIIPEPPGGAHTDHKATLLAVKSAIGKHLQEVKAITASRGLNGPSMLVQDRRMRYQNYGVFHDTQEVPNEF